MREPMTLEQVEQELRQWFPVGDESDKANQMADAIAAHLKEDEARIAVIEPNGIRALEQARDDLANLDPDKPAQPDDLVVMYVRRDAGRRSGVALALNGVLSLIAERNRERRRAEQAEAKLASLQAEVAEAVSVLSPSMPESGLVDACKQVKQVAISEADNSEKLEAALAMAKDLAQQEHDLLNATIASLRAKLVGLRDIREGSPNTFYAAVDRILAGEAEPS